MKNFLQIVLLISLSANPCFSAHTDSTSSHKNNSELIFEKRNTELTLSNPGIPGKFFVIGTLSFYHNTMTYQVYSDTVFLSSASRVFRYNHMVKDFEIPYDKIKKVRGGVFFLFFHRKVIVDLNDKITYKFIVAKSSDRKEVLKFLNGQMK